LLCQVILEHCKWDNGELYSKSPWLYTVLHLQDYLVT
jgi:hypothetical protein